MDQGLKSRTKRSNLREPLAFAYVGLILFMVVYFVRPEDWIPGLIGIPLAKITGILIFLSLVFPLLRIRWHVPQEIIFLILLVVQLWVAAIYSPVWKGGAVNMVIDFSKVLPIVFIIYAAVRSMTRLRWILFVQAASVGTIAIASIISRQTVVGRLQGVLQGIYRDPNDLAVLIDLTLPLCLALALTTGSFWKRLAWIALMFAMTYVVFLTGSRAGAVAFAVAGLMCVWKMGVKRRRLSLILLTPLTVMVFWLYAGKLLRDRFEQGNADPATRNQSRGAYESSQSRLLLLTKSLKVTAQHPLLGVGPNNFEIVSGTWHATHNTYTQMSAEGGIPAFLFYVLIFWRSLCNIRTVGTYSNTTRGIRLFSMALEASLAAYLVGSFFLSLGYELFPYCLVAYTSALRLIARRDRLVSNRAEGLPPAQVETTKSNVVAYMRRLPCKKIEATQFRTAGKSKRYALWLCKRLAEALLPV
jgi:O-antigen ligase